MSLRADNQNTLGNRCINEIFWNGECYLTKEISLIDKYYERVKDKNLFDLSVDMLSGKENCK